MTQDAGNRAPSGPATGLTGSGRGTVGAIAVLLLLTAAACTGPQTSPKRVSGETHVSLHGHSLTLHLSNPVGSARREGAVLLVYATGDAGWWGKDRAMFNHLIDWGYPVVGFSARDYVHHLGSEAVSPGEIADDYQAIITTGRQALGITADTLVVLVGKSRGAGLAVVAAGVPRIKSELAGVVAVGLTREEEYAYRPSRLRPRERVMLETYEYLPRLGHLPLAVIQSSGDSYVPAAAARQLFGPDSDVRQLVAVNGDNHNFGGALDVLYRELERSIEWIVQR